MSWRNLAKHLHVCLFPTRKACDDLNHQMLSSLPSEVAVMSCTDDIDQTSSTRRWTKKATEHLEKLNKDCNMLLVHTSCSVVTLIRKLGW